MMKLNAEARTEYEMAFAKGRLVEFGKLLTLGVRTQLRCGGVRGCGGGVRGGSSGCVVDEEYEVGW
ncbi:hypothetical protein L195_g057227 [Trifolium pratense]|uniref:Uncharacterized protein n=1 Tax=Trifolium pratense TaxID=57577 RepID=A0A2K3KVE9_TRIPR|nr:hypothetical protein L195_g057227 [Trifolium pratense]